MRMRRIAHRDLRLANVLLAPDGRPWLIDFGFAEIAATDQMQDTDVAELLSSTALKVGVKRSVDAAISVIGKSAVASAAPRIQPLALSTATRKSLVARKPLCDDLRKYAGEASDAGDVEPQDLQRIKPRTVLVFISLAVAFYLLIPQLADVSGVWSKLKEADWTWALYALGASALTYVGATIGLLGAVPRRIPLIGTFATQLAGSFVNRIVPARVGGIATNVRFLQKQGLDLAVASSSVGLQQLSGLLMHLSLSVVFLLWAGRSGVGAFDFMPSSQTVLIGLTVILALSGLLFLLPAGRGVLRKRVFPILKRSGQGIGDVARRPFKVAELFGGSVFLTLCYISALVFSVHAFGATGVSVASIGVVFLVGSAISSVAPTPGGIGAVEAALIAGLTAVGLERDVAVPAVFLYRIATFWLPIVPGWIAFVLLQRRGDL
jgi:undecaprenyl-diphosphatase